jgi:hypothetical protein
MGYAPTTMATIPVPPHLRERLAALVKARGSARAAADALCVEPRALKHFIDSARAREATVVLFETRLQALEGALGDFEHRQELAGLVADLVGAGKHFTVADVARQHVLKGRAIDTLSAVLRLVAGTPSTDGRVLQLVHENAPGGPAVWKVEPAPAREQETSRG